MIYPPRVEPIIDFSTLSDAERHRATMMGRKGKPDASNVMRIMIKFAHAASINEGLDVRQDHHILTMRLFQFLCERTLWLYDCEYLWSRHRLSAQKDRIDDEDRYIDAATLLSQINAMPYSKHDWHFRLRSAREFGHAAAPESLHGTLALLDDEGITGELIMREARSGRVEVSQMWGRPESVRQEFRRIRAQ